jgi:hypothetical protein
MPSRRDQLLDDSVAALRMVIAQLRELDAASRAASQDAAARIVALASSHERSDRH